MNCIKNGKFTGDSCFGCEIKADNCEIRYKLLFRPRWIPVSERLPEDLVNPITRDAYVYPVTVDLGRVTDIRYYSFCRGHWYNQGPKKVDSLVIAWMPLPEPYSPQKLGLSGAAGERDNMLESLLYQCKHCVGGKVNEIGETLVFCELTDRLENVTLGNCLGNCEAQEYVEPVELEYVAPNDIWNA